MPKELERKLKAQAAKHDDWSEERKDAYTYGTLRKTGWKPEREKHGSLEDITFHEEAAQCERILEDLGVVHPIHKGYKGDSNGSGLETGGAIAFGNIDFRKIDLDGGVKVAGNESALRDIGTGIHLGAPVDYFGPDTDYRAEEIDPHQYGKDFEPFPFRDYYKTEDKQWERGFRMREQDEYDETPTPGAVTDRMPHVEAYGAVNFAGAGPDKDGDGDEAGSCDYRSFESQRHFARANKGKSAEYAVDISGLDTKLGKDIR